MILLTGGDNMNGSIGELHDLFKEYVNYKTDRYKLKGVEVLSFLSCKAIVLLVATMLGAVMLQLMGFASAFFIGDLTGSTALGFAIVSVMFAAALAVVYAKRESLFLGGITRMYMKIFFSGGSRHRGAVPK